MELHVRSWGSGERYALLVHGLFGDSASWYRLAPALVDRGYHVLAPDLRGHGNSLRGRYSPHDWAMDLVQTLPRGADLAIGHSLGGLVLGMVAEVLAPATAVYLDPAWRIDADRHRRYREVWNGWLQWTEPAQLRAHLGPRWPDRDVQLRWDSMWATDPGVIPGLVPGCGHDLSPESASMPSLVLAADPSDFIPPVYADEVRARGLTVSVVPGSGHSTFREDFDGFLATLDAWIATSTSHRRQEWGTS